MRRLLTFLLVGAALGVTVFAVLARRAAEIETVDPEAAAKRFEVTRERALRDISTSMERGLPPAARPTKIGLLLYDAPERRLVSAEIPFWFFRLKSNVLQLAFEDTDLDLEEHGATPRELTERGPGVVVDETRQNGNCYLIWTW